MRVQKGDQRPDANHKTMQEMRQENVSSEIIFSDWHKANGVSRASLERQRV